MTNSTLTLTKFWKVVTIVVSIGIFSLFSYLLVYTFTQKNLPILWAILMGLIGLVMIGFSIYGTLSALIDKVVFTDQGIEFIEFSKTRVLDKTDITGYEVDDNYIHLFTNSDSYKISTYYAGSSEVLGWLSANYNDLEQERYDAEEEEIINDVSFGLDASERAQNLDVARKRVKVYNVVAVIIGMLLFFYPKPYDVMLGVGIVTPLIGMLFVATSKGLIKINESTGKAYPSILSGTMMCVLAVFLRGFIDFDILGYTTAILPITICTVLCGGVLIALDTKSRSTKSSVLEKIAYIVFALTYSYGLVIHFNCYYDFSDSSSEATEILDKRETSGSDTNYYLEVDASFDGYEFEKLEVSEAKYRGFEIGDSIDINIYPGRLGISWMTVD